MQTLICMISMEEEEKFVENSIKDHIFDMAIDQNATHVLQKILSCFPEDKLEYIFYPIIEHFLDLSMDANGLCVVKKQISLISKPSS